MIKESQNIIRRSIQLNVIPNILTFNPDVVPLDISSNLIITELINYIAKLKGLNPSILHYDDKELKVILKTYLHKSDFKLVEFINNKNEFSLFEYYIKESGKELEVSKDKKWYLKDCDKDIDLWKSYLDLFLYSNFNKYLTSTDIVMLAERLYGSNITK